MFALPSRPNLPSLIRTKSGVTYSGDLPAGDLTVGGHSHIVDYTSSPARWWVATVVFVHDASIWPDFTGRCPAGRGCLTSVTAIRAAQRAGKAEADVPTNVWFDFSVRPVDA